MALRTILLNGILRAGAVGARIHAELLAAGTITADKLAAALARRVPPDPNGATDGQGLLVSNNAFVIGALPDGGVTHPVRINTGSLTSGDNGGFLVWKDGTDFDWVLGEWAERNGFSVAYNSADDTFTISGVHYLDAVPDAAALASWDVGNLFAVGATLYRVTEENSVKGTAAVISPYQLPGLLAEYNALLSGGAYSLVTDGVAQASWAAEPTLAQMSAATYDDYYRPGPVQNNQWYAVRTVSKADPDDHQIRVGDQEGDLDPDHHFATIELSTASQVEGTGYDYTAVQITRVPAADSIVLMRFGTLEVDGRINLPAYWRRPERRDTLPSLNGLRRWTVIDLTAAGQTYDVPTEFSWRDASGLGAGVRELPLNDDKNLDLISFPVSYPSNPNDANETYLRIASEGASSLIADTIDYNGNEYTVNRTAHVGRGQLWYEVDGLTRALAEEVPEGHPANTALISFQRRDGTYLNDGAAAAVGLLVWTGTAWLPLTAAGGGGSAPTVVRTAFATQTVAWPNLSGGVAQWTAWQNLGTHTVTADGVRRIKGSITVGVSAPGSSRQSIFQSRVTRTRGAAVVEYGRDGAFILGTEAGISETALFVGADVDVVVDDIITFEWRAISRTTDIGNYELRDPSYWTVAVE